MNSRVRRFLQLRPSAWHPSTRSATSLATETLAVGLLLILAGFLKLHQWALEGVPTANPLALWLLSGVPALEILLGMWIISGIEARKARLVGLFCFGAFAGASLISALRGKTSCGCFGVIEVNPWWTFLLDLVVVGLLAIRRSRHPPWSFDLANTAAQLKALVGAGVVVASFATLATVAVTLTRGTSVLETGDWEGRRCPLLDLVDIGPALSEGNWIVVLVRSGCEDCHTAIPSYEQRAESLSRTGNSTRIALIDVSSAPRVESQAGWACLWGRLENSRSWHVQTPTEITLRDGVVEKIRGIHANPTVLMN